jgi:hypothetical protein
MKEKSGYKRECLSTRFDEWRMRWVRKWKYTWSDGTIEIKHTYSK